MSNSTHSISVALCTFNGAQYLEQQLLSIAKQTIMPAELVVCDDGSTDQTLETIARFAQRVEFPVRVHQNQSRLGPSQNFGKAIRLCSGRFIALSDQDDEWLPNKLETLRNILEARSAGGIFSDGWLMDGNSTTVHGTLWRQNRFFDSEQQFNRKWNQRAIATLLRNNVVTGATLMFRSDLRETLLPIPDDWMHDGWIAWMLVLHSTLLAINLPLIRYRVHTIQHTGIPGNASGRLRRAREKGEDDYSSLERQFRALRMYCQSMGDSSLDEQFETKCQISRFRSQLPKNRVVRAWKILEHFDSYRLYAQGARSIVKDILR